MNTPRFNLVYNRHQIVLGECSLPELIIAPTLDSAQISETAGVSCFRCDVGLLYQYNLTRVRVRVRNRVRAGVMQWRCALSVLIPTSAVDAASGDNAGVVAAGG